MKFNRNFLGVTFIAALVLASAVLLVIGLNQRDPAVAQSTPLSGNRQTRSNSEGAVTVNVTWLADVKGSIMLNVIMDTHSVDLDGYDLSRLAVLRDDQGKQYTPTSWESGPGGHHRSGVLTFPTPASISAGSAAYFEVVIRDVAGVAERILKWDF